MIEDAALATSLAQAMETARKENRSVEIEWDSTNKVNADLRWQLKRMDTKDFDFSGDWINGPKQRIRV